MAARFNCMRGLRGGLFGGLIAAVLAAGCEKSHPAGASLRADASEEAAYSQADTMAQDRTWPRPRSEDRLSERRRMVRTLAEYGIDDPRVLEAMEQVPRHWFVNEPEQPWAYADRPLPIGHGQTISQPFIVAYMTWVLELDADSKVLEIGTGSGYQAAILNEFTPNVYTIEIVAALGRQAQQSFARHGYTTISARIGDGYAGWAEHAPFDAIIVTCAPDDIPEALIEQLKPTGRMVIPVGSVSSVQQLVLVTKGENGVISKRMLMPVRFVPMVEIR